MYGTKAMLRSDEENFFNNIELPLGKIGEGETVVYTRALMIPNDWKERSIRFSIIFTENSDNVPANIDTTLIIKRETRL